MAERILNPEFLKALAELIKAVSWPLVVVIILIMVGRDRLAGIIKEIESLIPKIKSLSVFGIIEAKIRKEVNEQVNAVAEAPLSAEQLPTEGQLEAAKRVGQIALQVDISVVRQELSDSAREYERLRIAMPSGDERTRQMEAIVARIVAKVRTLAIAGYALLKEFAESTLPGDRLVAVIMLQVRPSPDYIRWLGERVSEERAFLGYHAAIALLSAARLEASYHALETAF